MNKRIISREIILSSFWDGIKGILSAEAFIIKDEWSNIFLKNVIDIKKYQERRLSAISEYEFYRGISFDTQIELSHIGNVILNLNLNPKSIDHYLANCILNENTYLQISDFENKTVQESLDMRRRLESKIDYEVLVKNRSEKISKIIDEYH
jgi:hypothetical protein